MMGAVARRKIGRGTAFESSITAIIVRLPYHETASDEARWITGDTIKCRRWLQALKSVSYSFGGPPSSFSFFSGFAGAGRAGSARC
jgi:hypothetical protein